MAAANGVADGFAAGEPDGFGVAAGVGVGDGVALAVAFAFAYASAAATTDSRRARSEASRFATIMESALTPIVTIKPITKSMT